MIRARMGSDRLPGRIIAPLGGRPLLALLRARVAAARVDAWWLATSRRPTDDVTEAWGFELGLRVHRGADPSPHAALRAIAAETGAEWIVSLDASHPFVDAGLIDAMLDARDARRESKEAPAIRLGGPERADGDADPAPGPALPRGYSVEAIRCAALEEDPCPGGCVGVQVCPAPGGWPSRPGWRWAIDSYEDLAMARSAFRVFGREAETIDYPAMVAALDAHPEIAAMNADGGATGRPAPEPAAQARAEASTRWTR